MKSVRAQVPSVPDGSDHHSYRSEHGQECSYIPFFPKFLFYFEMHGGIPHSMHAMLRNTTALESHGSRSGVILIQPHFHFTRKKGETLLWINSPFFLLYSYLCLLPT